MTNPQQRLGRGGAAERRAKFLFVLAGILSVLFTGGLFVTIGLVAYHFVLKYW